MQAATHRHEERRTFDHTWLEGRPPRILLAEDDAEMRTLLALALRRDGFDVCEVADGGHLLERLGSDLLRAGGAAPPDLIVSDIRMPVCTGLAALAGVRHADWATPFILITAFGDEETHTEARRLGAAAVFDKPFDVDDFRTAVWHVAGKR